MIVGYQGEHGSHAEQAAKTLLRQAGIEEYDLQPCKTIAGVMAALANGSIQMGVYAVSNNIAGPVPHAAEAEEKYEPVVLQEFTYGVKHCLFSLPNVEPEDVEFIYSHSHALEQCRESMKELCPNATPISMSDTAAAAKALAEGDYADSKTAVICAKNAGEHHNLTLMAEGFEDRTSLTDFKLVRSKNPVEPVQSTTEETARSVLLSPVALEWTIKGLIILTIFGAFVARDHFGWSSWDSAVAVAGISASIVLFLSSRKLHYWANLWALSGEWEYEIVPFGDYKAATQSHDLKRIVRIDSGDGDTLSFRGWREGDAGPNRWENKEVLISRPGTRKGRLVYEYTNTHEHLDDQTLDGIVYLSWNRRNPTGKIMEMSGWYTGFATGDVGRIRYRRIDPDKFYRLKNGIHGS